MEICFILVNPARPENVGGAARAIHTMGFQHMRLVTPCDHLGPHAKGVAVGSASVLDNAQVYPSLEKAIHDIDLVVGTTVRKRKSRLHPVPCVHLPKQLHEKADLYEKVGIVFGSEANGLTTKDLALCDIVSTIPIATSYPSLNLGQAVMLFAWVLSSNAPLLQPVKLERASEGQYRVLKNNVGDLLQQIGIFPGESAYKRVVAGIANLSRTDVGLVHTLNQKIQGMIDRGRDLRSGKEERRCAKERGRGNTRLKVIGPLADDAEGDQSMDP